MGQYPFRTKCPKPSLSDLNFGIGTRKAGRRGIKDPADGTGKTAFHISNYLREFFQTTLGISRAQTRSFFQKADASAVFKRPSRPADTEKEKIRGNNAESEQAGPCAVQNQAPPADDGIPVDIPPLPAEGGCGLLGAADDGG